MVELSPRIPLLGMGFVKFKVKQLLFCFTQLTRIETDTLTLLVLGPKVAVVDTAV